MLFFLLEAQLSLPTPLDQLVSQAGLHFQPSQVYISSVAVWLTVHHTHFLFCLHYISQPPLQLGVAMCLTSSQHNVWVEVICTTSKPGSYKPFLCDALISFSFPQLDAQGPFGSHLLEIVDPQDGRACMPESWFEGEPPAIRNIHLCFK